MLQFFFILCKQEFSAQYNMFRMETLNIRFSSLMFDWTFIRNLILIWTTPRVFYICIIVGFFIILFYYNPTRSVALNCFVCGLISETTICHICTEKISRITLAKPWIMRSKKLYSVPRSTCVVVIWHTHAQCSPMTAVQPPQELRSENSGSSSQSPQFLFPPRLAKHPFH